MDPPATLSSEASVQRTVSTPRLGTALSASSVEGVVRTGNNIRDSLRRGPNDVTSRNAPTDGNDTRRGHSDVADRHTNLVGNSQRRGNSEGMNRVTDRVGDGLRRGHSDGDVLSSGARRFTGTGGNELIQDGETWRDFLRHSTNVGIFSEEEAQMSTRRAAAVTADRKRRFTGQQEAHARRGSPSGQSYGQTPSDRATQCVFQSTNNHPLIVFPRISDSRPLPRITDRPLPPRPEATSSPNRGSREIVLPRWQPDAEVSSCPLCATHFNFWYRKHHCRKCGRVVCANCSPHRITIPRQFIVHSPLEADTVANAESVAESAIIDLTGDDEHDMTRLHGSSQAGRRQGQDYRIDSALGGGQEVRLCNPCVPDPNPLPYPAFTMSSQYMFNAFPSPETNVRAAQHPGEPSGMGFDRQSSPSSVHVTVSGQQIQSSNRSAGPNLGLEQSFASSTRAITTDRHESHFSRAPGANPHLPPNYSLLYGSAPDPSFHEASEKLVWNVVLRTV